MVMMVGDRGGDVDSHAMPGRADRLSPTTPSTKITSGLSSSCLGHGVRGRQRVEAAQRPLQAPIMSQVACILYTYVCGGCVQSVSVGVVDVMNVFPQPPIKKN